MGLMDQAGSEIDQNNTSVFVDAGPFSYSRLTGLSRYTARLTMALASRVPIRFFSEGEELLAPGDLDWSPGQDLARWSRRVWRSKRQPLAPGPDGSIGLYCTLRPLHRNFPFEVSVLHDFSPYTVPHTHLESTRRMFGGFFSKALPLSDLAIAVSHSTKADAAWLSHMDPNRVVVAHSGPSLCIGRHEHSGKVRRRQNVGLVVSTLEPRKNARFLFEWFQSSKTLPDDAELWWVGPLGWLTSRRELKKLKGSGRQVRFLGVVSDQALCKLYRTAGWSIYPSLYEGFGFPVLDALRHGTPTLASGNSSIREFDSPGLHLFDPCDASTVDDAWRALQAEGPIEIPREPLDRLYSWEHVASKLLEAHRRSRLSPGRPTHRAA
ncbi:glycosyltransferase family 4 protein [Tundrisphaera lichenicola]|uniref:glycosyltransferase family 4 protein n=1 Tax=Tundrisphaera lichenicola TaxID=2029860 RepID=UPI003EB7C0E2